MWYYRLTSSSYTEAYRKLADSNVSKNPKGKCSGEWGSGIGNLQYEFLREEGLQPNGSLLDIGCGKLRGGRFLIEYLNAGNYTGMDISEAAIEEGKRRLGDRLLEEKSPTFLVNDDLEFNEFSSEGPFNFLLAQSVFTHLPLGPIRECLENVSGVMTDSSRFYATVILRKSGRSASSWNFAHRLDDIRGIASENGLEVIVYDEGDYPHPQGQRMLCFRRG